MGNKGTAPTVPRYCTVYGYATTVQLYRYYLGTELGIQLKPLNREFSKPLNREFSKDFFTEYGQLPDAASKCGQLYK